MNKLQVTLHDPAGKVVYDRLHTSPSGWNELTAAQLLAWAGTMVSKQKLTIARIVLASLLYQIPKRLYKCINKADALIIAGSTDFLFKKNELNNWLIPAIWRGIFKYHGPKDRLVNVTVNELEKCEYCYEQFTRTKNPDYLDTLAAILYRPRRFWGIDNDIRTGLTNYGYIRRAKRFKKLSPALKTAIFLNYEGCRHYLHKKYKDVFTGGKATGTAQTSVTPWPKIIESGSNDIFGSHETTKNTLAHDFLSRLDTRTKEMKELEANNKS